MQHRLRQIWSWILYASLLLATGIGTSAGQSARTADGMTVYLGVVPAEIVQQRYEKGTPEAEMHGGTATQADRYHVMVSLFDSATGARIEDADVVAAVSPVGLGASQGTLEPMAIGDTITYGAYFRMPQAGDYTLEVEIRRPGVSDATSIRFQYQRP